MNEDPAMMDMDPTGDDALAMDVALGALGREELRSADRRMRSDPAFRALVEGWQSMLAPLGEEIAPLAPPPSVWDAVVAEIAPAAAAKIAPAASWWNSLNVWRALAVGSAFAAAVALLPIASQPAPVVVAAAPAPMLVATLKATDGTALIAAAYDPVRGAVVLAPASERDDPGKSAELWVIEGKSPPRSLGVIDVGHANAHLLTGRRIAGLKPGSTLAISIEPLGGSPTGKPTGPVVATGTLSSV